MASAQFKTEAFMSITQWAGLIGFCTVLILFALFVKSKSKKNAPPKSDKAEDASLCQVTSKRLSRTLIIHSIEKSGKFATVLESDKNIIQLTFAESEQLSCEVNDQK